MKVRAFITIAILAGSVTLTDARKNQGEAPMITAFFSVLKEVVKEERVDYSALKARPADLRVFLDLAAAMTEADFRSWPESKQIAFLINLYNARTLLLIIDHYPIASIKKIGNLLKGPWDQPVVRLFGQTMTLGHLEHEILRKRYNEPRIHFALVCAAKGCPPLRAEPYAADALDRQLDDQGRRFMRDSAKNRLDRNAGVLYLSPIFDWFKNDFTGKSESLQAFVAPYLSAADASFLTKNTVKIRFTDYDWSLNDRAGAAR
ncbi:MAG: hypothetical protein A2992_09425 [Elusimicrobia bacterium RIFCSPLOWO2_01_FULL_59_12]|nr:MAG: hypothetical protein A2992_09425 [Elusimicrobia bacterium RIFCSPLOWO2_01_FULL_59_12]